MNAAVRYVTVDVLHAFACMPHMYFLIFGETTVCAAARALLAIYLAMKCAQYLYWLFGLY